MDNIKKKFINNKNGTDSEQQQQRHESFSLKY